MKRLSSVGGLQRTRDGSADMQQREQLRAWQQLTKRLKHLFPAPHPGQPVVDYRHTAPTNVGRAWPEGRHVSVATSW